MDNVKLFETRTARDSFIMGPDYTIPHVSGLVDSEEVTYNSRLVSFLNKLATYHDNDALVAEECKKAVEASKNNLNFDKCILIQRVPITETQTDPETEEEVEVEIGCDYEYVEITPSSGSITSTQTSSYKANTVAAIFPYGINAGANCFENAANLRTCNLDTMSSIGASAFSGCTNLGLTENLLLKEGVVLGNNCLANTSFVSIPTTLNVGSGTYVSAFNGYTNISDLTLKTTTGSINHTGASVGNGNGTLTIEAPTINGIQVPGTKLFKHVILKGTVTVGHGSYFLNAGNKIYSIQIDGNLSFTGNSGYFSYTAATPYTGCDNFNFFEVTGSIISNSANHIIFYTNNNRSLGSNMIIHLAKTDGIAGSPSCIKVNHSRVTKVYVGDGSSLENDQAVLALYLADTDWATYSSKLDCWYNYTGEYKDG